MTSHPEGEDVSHAFNMTGYPEGKICMTECHSEARSVEESLENKKTENGELKSEK